MRLAMTLLVLDAADVLEPNLRYHRAQGVDFFVVADNGSTDGSLEILERFERAGLVTLERMTGSQHAIWTEGRTRVARLAHELGADWVIHNDQDEFWWPLTGNLKEALAHIPPRYGLVLAPRTEFPARPGDGSFAARMTVRESRFLHPPKVAHRTHPRIVVDQPHPTRVSIEDGASSDPFSGRPGLDLGGPGHAARIEDPLVFAPTFPVRVLHFPLRSFEQYRERIDRAEHSGLLDVEGREDVRAAYEAGRLDELYARLSLDDEQVARGVAEGWLVVDTDFRDYLAAAPDPLAADSDPPPGSRSWPEERRRRELDELEFDAMYALTRYTRRRGTSGGRKGRVQALRESAREARRHERRTRGALARATTKEREARRRLEEIKGSRWWRLRPRLPRRWRR